jgi:AbrB family looped-hinge helix DNA binding protein
MPKCTSNRTLDDETFCGILSWTSKNGVAMRITAKGQVTIPQEIRERAGLMPGTDVEFEIEGSVVRLVKSHSGAGRKTARDWSKVYADRVTSR